ncbi:WxL domain surface cell wall-binding [Pilibacter termitis]|uniref:WxL domain surface cell wall-binding n=1 Tax=Pilibacter termitis TaxID=263852 RepID=A0A1T4Q705_9ENTE|nr:WxL domain-containing protein [Pilibacter termitis]SJZ99535.1 WxL domain surface cell wall-binding [Pilibacter termitis]
MKKKVLGTVLVCASVLSVVTPLVANADTFDGTGKIAWLGKGPDPKDPANITPAIDPDQVGGDSGRLKGGIGQTMHAGELTIDAVSPLDFGTQTISTTAKTYQVVNKAVIEQGTFRAPTAAEVAAGATTAIFAPAAPAKPDLERGHFVQWTDARADTISSTGSVTAAKHGWTLDAKLTKQFSVTATPSSGTPVTYTLNGATLDYSNPLRNHTNGVGATLTKPAFTLAYNTSVQVATADQTNGRGTHTLEFGQVGDHYANTQSTYAGATAPADNIDKALAVTSGTDSYKKSVLLNVPAGNNIQKAIYTADITWTLTAAP